MVKLTDLQKHELKEWSDEVEEILRTLSEKAQIWRLLHMKNHDIFKRKYYCLIIPVTILSSVTGAANLALGSLATGNDTIVNLVIGALGIIISVISTLNNIFSFQKRKDEHYRSAKDWYRVQRMIDIELSLQKSKRNNVSVFFHLVLQEIERIHEFHPNIREDVIRRFMKSYKNKKLNIDIPEILSIRKTLVFKDDINTNEKLSIVVETPQNNINNVKNINNIIPSQSQSSTINRQGTFINLSDDNENKDEKKRNSFISKIVNPFSKNTDDNSSGSNTTENSEHSTDYSHIIDHSKYSPEIKNNNLYNNSKISNVSSVSNEISVKNISHTIIKEQYPFEIHNEEDMYNNPEIQNDDINNEIYDEMYIENKEQEEKREDNNI